MSFRFPLIFIFGMVGILHCTVDLNFKELQYLAGKLKKHECRRLAESLHNRKLYSVKPQKFTGKHEPNKTCLFLLMKYDRTEGKGKNFIALDVRLRQIGRPDLADKLSKQVYHEKTLGMKKNFIDDPYRKMIHKNSFFLDDEKKKKKLVKVEKPYEFNWEHFWISTAAFLLVILTCVSCRICCPQFGRSFARTFCSKGTIDMCNLCNEECNRCCKKCKLNYDKHVTGLEVEVNMDEEELLMREAGLLDGDLTGVLDGEGNDKAPLIENVDKRFARRSGILQAVEYQYVKNLRIP